MAEKSMLADRIWQIPEPDCDCKRDKHEARPAHPATMIGRT